MATGLMETFTTGIKTAIEASASITAPVKVRRTVEIDEKRNATRTFVTIAPGEERVSRAESPTSYIVELNANIRISAVYATDAAAITALAELVMNVRKAIYGQDFGGRRFVSTDIEGEYQTDDVTQNHYYYDMTLYSEYQEST